MDKKREILLDYTVKELKEILREGELPIIGNKRTLVDRILEELDIEFKETEKIENLPTEKYSLNNMPTDLYFKMSESMAIKDVFNLCATDKSFNKWICKNDNFWRKRLKDDFKISYNGMNPKGEYEIIYKSDHIIELIKEFNSVKGFGYKVLMDKELVNSYIKRKNEDWKPSNRLKFIFDQVLKDEKIFIVNKLQIEIWIKINEYFSILSGIPMNSYDLHGILTFRASHQSSIRVFELDIPSNGRYNGTSNIQVTYNRHTKDILINPPVMGKALYNPIIFKTLGFLMEQNMKKGPFYKLIKKMDFKQ